MKILLVKPPLNPNMMTTTRGEPLELEYLAAAIQDHNVAILDMRIDRRLSKKLDEFKPEVVGITAYTCDANTAKQVLCEVKKHNRNIKTVIGGHHATFQPGDFALPYVDAIFLRMADYSFKEYIDALEDEEDVHHIKNIVLVKTGGLYFTEQEFQRIDLDSLPFPSRDLTAPYRNRYRDLMKNKTAFILTSRGCPYRCTFCACWKMMGGKYVYRKPESVVDELAQLPEETELICFADDNTLHSIQRAWQLSQLIKERKINKRFSLYARADTIVKHPDLIESLRDAGLEYITVGLESFRDNELEALNKKTSVRTNEEAIRILKRLEVSISAHLIVHPHYTHKDFEELFQYVCRMCLYRVAYTILTPLPGTDLYAEKLDSFAIRDTDYFDFVHSILPTKLDRREFYFLYAELYRKTYSLKRYFHSAAGSFRSLWGRPGNMARYKSDRISLFRIFLINIFGLPWYLKVRNFYKSEPIRACSGSPEKS